jgi:C-terminal processing protease CtpA/Prc
MDATAISAAETLLGIVKDYHLAELVGEPTAGTNGVVTEVRLPGRYVVSFTGMRVVNHDGSRHYGVGIRPTLPALRTVEGIAAGRDEQLERAIEVVDQ